ncbi:hypothetical protein BDV93DRAFT_506250 [Ceratobasidium sp. AG-I]|nr:hypothetical protein BDV93DRAFT_506250 [Ceratobasidium sp. AG-I]
MLEDHLARISFASKTLATAIQEYSATLSALETEVKLYYKSGLLKDRLMLRDLASLIDGPLETIASHTSHLRFVQTSLRKTKNDLTPVNSLHPELMARIFSITPGHGTSIPNIDVFGSYPADSFDLGMSAKRASLRRMVTFSSVCRYWRRIAISTGTLWSYTPIYLAGNAAQLSLDSAHVWLDRARTTPLDIFFIAQGFAKTPPSRAMLENALPLPLASKQIRTLSLSLVTTTYLDMLLNKCFQNNVSTTLTKLHVDVYNSGDIPSTVQEWLSRCQELQVLQLNIDALTSDRFPMLPKLVELKLFSHTSASLTTERLAALFHACPSLQRLMLSDVDLVNSVGHSLAPVPFSFLNTLVLQSTDLASVISLISSKSASLSLSIVTDERGLVSETLAVHIRDFCRRSTTTALHLDAEDIEWNDMHKMLRLFPDLLTLSLRNMILDNPVVGALRGTSELDADEEATPPTFPTLHAIWLAECQIDGEKPLRSLVSLRPLKQLKLSGCYLSPDEPVIEAKELVCMYWRRIALNHSVFWNYIPIFFTSQSIQHSLDGASVWLGRARTTPLDVFIETRDPEKTRLPKLPESSLVSALLKTPFSGKKIQALSLTLWSTIHFDPLIENWLGAGVCEALTELEIALGDPIGDSFQNWLSQCQELQCLSLNAGPLYDDSFPLLPKLAELELTWFGSPITALELANILRSCPNLRKLTLEGINIEATNDVDITPASLPHLSVLTFTELDATHILPIFSSNSNSLSLSIASTLPDETRGNLIDRISQLSRLSTITDLWLSVGDLEMHELRGLIYSLPHLQKLWLHDIQLDGPKALALRGVDKLGATPPTFPVPRSISLVESDIEDEAALRWLAKELCDYLREAVSDLHITGYDHGEVVHFP